MESAFIHISVDFIFSRGDKKKTARSCVTSEVPVWYLLCKRIQGSLEATY